MRRLKARSSPEASEKGKSLPKDDPYACRRSRLSGVVWEEGSREAPPYPDFGLWGVL
jgi:hypothetical protein